MESRKNGTDQPICREGMDAENRLVEESVTEHIAAFWHIYTVCVKWIAGEKLLMTQVWAMPVMTSKGGWGREA